MKAKLILILIILASCSSRKVDRNDCVEIYDRTIYDIYNIYFGKRDNDTIVFVGKRDELQTCNDFNFINKKKLKHIESVTLSTNETLVFTYKTKDANNWLTVRVVGGTSDKYFNTYSQFPYYLNDCSSLVGCE